MNADHQTNELDDLIVACRSGRQLLCDGAFGTQLFLRGLAPGECSMEWNERRPDDVAAVHRAYLDAGCNMITTNSFSGNRLALERHGLGEQVEKLNRRAVEIARSVAGKDAWILGDVGPCGEFLEPLGDLSPEVLRDIFAEQISALSAVDAIIIETMSATDEMAVAIAAAKTTMPKLPVIATYAFEKSAGKFHTMMGTSIEAAMNAAIAAGADIVGANCGTNLTLDDYVNLAESLRSAAGNALVILQPNAGCPQITPTGTVYSATPAEMADAARRIRDAGINIVGGCCGTSPELLAAMK